MCSVVKHNWAWNAGPDVPRHCIGGMLHRTCAPTPRTAVHNHHPRPEPAELQLFSQDWHATAQKALGRWSYSGGHHLEGKECFGGFVEDALSLLRDAGASPHQQPREFDPYDISGR